MFSEGKAFTVKDSTKYNHNIVQKSMQYFLFFTPEPCVGELSKCIIPYMVIEKLH